MKQRTRRGRRRRERTVLSDALAIGGGRYDGDPRRAVKARGQRTFGQLITFSQGEIHQLKSLKTLLVDYAGQPSPPRPLCLAVFGPPGSGKSYAVKQICEQARDDVPDGVKLPLVVVNVTQVADPGDLGRVLARIAGEQDEKTIPIIFIDEFDAPRDGARYGWLSWFLAPMHDGEFLHEGAVIRLKRAVYVLAGGTADTMDEFSRLQTQADFRLAKGPDFVSRLRGYLDVQGPNAAPREVRRALIFQKELKDRVENSRRGAAASALAFTVDPQMLTSLLSVGRYRHGARSITAIVEMSKLTAQTRTFTWPELPDDHLLRLHVDRGPLDAKRIRGSIALSGYAEEDPEPIVRCWLEVARALWREGATLAYAGRWITRGGELMGQLAKQLELRPPEPSAQLSRRERPDPWLESFLNDDDSIANVDAVMPLHKRERYGVCVVKHRYLTAAERRELKSDRWLRIAIARFRQRLAMSQACVARFAVTGMRRGHMGRAPGIAEELMLTLALGRPVYVAGGFGGAAQDVGNLLGLGVIKSGDMPSSFEPVPQEPQIVANADKFQPPPLTALPVTTVEMARFFKRRALGGKRWPDNGLNATENRRLFESRNGDEIAQLVVTGLQRIFRDRE